MQNINNYFVFVDESGTLPDVKDKFIVIAGVGAEKAKDAKDLISRILKSLRQRKIKIKEVKFYYSGERTKIQILSGIISCGFDIFIIAIDKKNRKISDTPENFALLISELINEINLWKPRRNLKIIIDRHFHRKNDEKSFNNFLQEKVKKNEVLEILNFLVEKGSAVGYMLRERIL